MTAAERMKGALIGRIALAAALIGCTLAVAQPLPAAAAPPSEEQCRTAAAALLDMLRTPPLAEARDEQRRKELLGEMERLAELHRSRGIDACTTWKEINYRAVHQ